MELSLIIGVAAFIVLGIMFALLWASSRKDELEDEVTREVIIKAHTGTIRVQAEVGDSAQEEEH